MADTRTEVAGSSTVIHWGAVLGGSFFAIGVWLFLLALGSAIQGGPGLTAWTAIYNLVAPIVALFFGGLVTSRSRYIGTRFDATMHGAVVWGFTVAIGALLTNMFGEVFLNRARLGAQVPSGFAWAIAGSILGSLIAALLGASYRHEREPTGRVVPREAQT